MNGVEGIGDSVEDRDGGPMGWLMGAVSAITDSPSSPFSPGRAGVTTSGYLIHTLMVNNIYFVLYI